MKALSIKLSMKAYESSKDDNDMSINQQEKGIKITVLRNEKSCDLVNRILCSVGNYLLVAVETYLTREG
jgi:hypothetical protein